VLDRSLRRRSLLRAGAVAGALAMTGLPTMALADKDDKDEKDAAKKIRKAHQFDVSGATAGGAKFTGKLRIMKFEVVQGAPNKLMANGHLSGKFRNLAGEVIATLDEAAFTTEVKAINPSGGAARASGVTAQAIPPPEGCTILHLVLSPLQLNLLGLFLTIVDTITLDLTAVPGGGLLGDLLCAVTNLLANLDLAALLGNLPLLGQLLTALNDLFDALNNL